MGVGSSPQCAGAAPRSSLATSPWTTSEELGCPARTHALTHRPVTACCSGSAAPCSSKGTIVSCFVSSCLIYLSTALPGSTFGQLWPSMSVSIHQSTSPRVHRSTRGRARRRSRCFGSVQRCHRASVGPDLAGVASGSRHHDGQCRTGSGILGTRAVGDRRRLGGLRAGLRDDRHRAQRVRDQALQCSEHHLDARRLRIGRHARALARHHAADRRGERPARSGPAPSPQASPSAAAGTRTRRWPLGSAPPGCWAGAVTAVPLGALLTALPAPGARRGRRDDAPGACARADLPSPHAHGRQPCTR